MATQAKWSLSGDYFENCNCDVVCPCLVSPAAPMTSRPSQGNCDVALFFHIDKGSYDQTSLDGLNVAVVAHTPGPMGEGNWTLAAYIDDRADGDPARLHVGLEDRLDDPPLVDRERGHAGERGTGDGGGVAQAQHVRVGAPRHLDHQVAVLDEGARLAVDGVQGDGAVDAARLTHRTHDQVVGRCTEAPATAKTASDPAEI